MSQPSTGAASATPTVPLDADELELRNLNSVAPTQRPTDAEHAAIRQRANDEADHRAYTSLSSAKDSAWIRGLAVEYRDLVDAHPLASVAGQARLARIAAILERSERDARLTPLERLGRELSSVVVQEILHAQREASQG
jgi:hypothetical protein